MSTSPHPSSVLAKEWVDIIRNDAAIAEKQGRLTDAQLALIYEQQWFNILVPAAYGGKELSLPDVIQLEETLAWADGSTGWVVTLCAGAGWFGGFLEPSFAEKTFADKKACLAGSGALTGTAEKTSDGFIVSGKWYHASGSPVATVFTANCIITQNGVPLKDDAGNDKVLSFTFLRDEVTILNTWNSMGMVATASHAYEVKDLFVPAEQTFIINSNAAHIHTPLYHYPFLQLAEATLAVNLSGMAVHFTDLCEALFNEKKTRKGTKLIDEPAVYKALQNALEELWDARHELHHAVRLSWQEGVEKKHIEPALLDKVSTTARCLALISRRSVDALYPYCGLRAADTSTELNRVWRDLHTASQHSLLVFG